MEIKNSLTMPKTPFEMRGNLNVKEPNFLKKWKEMNLYNAMMEKNANKPHFILHDGPPYANGDIHLGHALNKILKDIVLKYKTQLGHYTPYVPGYDAHGLPIENKVEHLMGIKDKQEIEEDIGIAAFVDKCREFAMENKVAMEKEFDSLGVWMDWDDPYMTLDPKYMESSWWTI